MYQHKNSLKQARTTHWNKLGLSYLPPARMNSLYVNTAKHARSLRKIEEETLCSVPSSCNVQKCKVTVLKSSNLSSEIHEYRPSSSYHEVPADPRNKMLEWRLATLNASSPTLPHALQQVKAARIGVICQSASSAPHFLLARMQGYSFRFVFQLVFPTYTLQLPSISALPTALKKF